MEPELACILNALNEFSSADITAAISVAFFEGGFHFPDTLSSHDHLHLCLGFGTAASDKHTRDNTLVKSRKGHIGTDLSWVYMQSQCWPYHLHTFG